jgi:hypothetical protein
MKGRQKISTNGVAASRLRRTGPSVAIRNARLARDQKTTAKSSGSQPGNRRLVWIDFLLGTLSGAQANLLQKPWSYWPNVGLRDLRILASLDGRFRRVAIHGCRQRKFWKFAVEADAEGV